LFAFVGASTEPPRASWGRSTRSNVGPSSRTSTAVCDSLRGIGSFPVRDPYPPVHRSDEHPLQAPVRRDPPHPRRRRLRPRSPCLPLLLPGGQAAPPRPLPAPPHLGGPARPPL